MLANSILAPYNFSFVHTKHMQLKMNQSQMLMHSDLFFFFCNFYTETLCCALLRSLASLFFAYLRLHYFLRSFACFYVRLRLERPRFGNCQIGVSGVLAGSLLKSPVFRTALVLYQATMPKHLRCDQRIGQNFFSDETSAIQSCPCPPCRSSSVELY